MKRFALIVVAGCFAPRHMISIRGQIPISPLLVTPSSALRWRGWTESLRPLSTAFCRILPRRRANTMPASRDTRRTPVLGCSIQKLHDFKYLLTEKDANLMVLAIASATGKPERGSTA